MLEVNIYQAHALVILEFLISSFIGNNVNFEEMISLQMQFKNVLSCG